MPLAALAVEDGKLGVPASGIALGMAPGLVLELPLGRVFFEPISVDRELVAPDDASVSRLQPASKVRLQTMPAVAPRN